MSSVSFDLNLIVLLLSFIVGMYIGQQIALIVSDVLRIKRSSSLSEGVSGNASPQSGYRSHKILVPLLAIGVFLSIFSFTLVSSPKVGATTLFVCTANNMPSWDWPSWVAKSSPRSGTITGGAVPGFSATTSSYVILGENVNSSGTGYNNFVLFTPSDLSDKLVLYMSGGDERIKTLKGGTIYSENVHDPQTSGSSGTGYPAVFAVVFADSITTADINTVSSQLSWSTSCYAGTKNVVYDSSWTDPQIAGSVGWTTGAGGAGGSCSSIVDIACFASNLYTGVTNDILHVFQAFTGGLYVLFVPQDSQIQSDFNSTSSALSAKLGFLTWPFSFAGSVWTAFTTPTTTCCTFGAGSFLGGHFDGVNIAQWATTAPDLWSWFTAVVKGVTIIGLLFALRRKYLEVTGR